MLLQQQRYFTQETFEVSPIETRVDIFIPFWWVAKHPPQGEWEETQIRFNSLECLEKCTKHEADQFSLAWDETVSLEPAAQTIGYISTVSNDDSLGQVHVEFRPYLDVMGKEITDALPKDSSYDCKIDLKEGSTTPWGPIYPVSENELQTLREWLKEMERTGKIRQSTSLVGSPILFVPKPNGKGLRLCVDYRAWNKITIPNRYPLPLMQDLQDRVQGARWLTKADLTNGFNLIRIRKRDEWKTAFRTRYDLYEFQVMPFGLTNAPSTFQGIY